MIVLGLMLAGTDAVFRTSGLPFMAVGLMGLDGC